VEAVILFPAIDLKNGQCVRLEQGDMARATVFSLDPAAQARAFAAQGFEYLHVVDLDGALPANRSMRRRWKRCCKPSPRPCNWAAASATPKPSKRGWVRASPASSSAPRRFVIPLW